MNPFTEPLQMTELPWNDGRLSRELKDVSWDGHENRVLYLLEKGTNPNHQYWFPLHMACWNGHFHCAELIIVWGADLRRRDVEGWTPLHYACYHNNMACVKILLKHNSPTDLKDTEGKTPVDLAKRKGNKEIADYIANYKDLVTDPLQAYPSIKQVSNVKVKKIKELGGYFRLTEDQMWHIRDSQHPTTEAFIAAKVNNRELRWKDIVQALLSIDECKQLGLVYSEQVCGHADGPNVCTLNLACTNGHFEIARHIITSDIQETLFHAAKNGHGPEAEFLLTEYHANPNVANCEEKTPLALASDPNTIKILLRHGALADNVYKAHSKQIGTLSSKRPPEIPLPILITGDGGVGKSTFLKSILSSKGLLARFSKPKPVEGVDEKTVGIVLHQIETKEFGRVICYDFAGQQVFYASHCAVLKNAVQTSPPIIIYLADLQEDDEQKTIDSMARWMTLVQNQCTNLRTNAHVIVVGSHADMLKEKRQNPWEKEKSFHEILKYFPQFDFQAFIPMDCRYPDTDQMKGAKKLIQTSSALLRTPETISLNAHTFYIYLLDYFKNDLGVTLSDVQQQIHRDLDQVKSKRIKDLLSFIPSNLPRLLEVCDQLSKKNLIIYLHNEDNSEKSFIICDHVTLLSNITGTVFAPENFRQHCKLASSTGVVPLCRFCEQFKAYNIDMLIAFMSHLELCFEIKDKQVLNFIRIYEENPEPDSRYLFFPGLIRIEIPDQIWEEDSTMSCHFGWITECQQDIEFFDPRCLQVLILRLVFTFNLAPARRIQRHIPSLQRFCSVWKNGIFWCNEDGVNSHIELSDNGKSFVLKMRSRVLTTQFLTIRSQIITKILETVKDFCPNTITAESIIDPHEVIKHPLNSASILTLCSLPDLARAVVSKREDVKCERKTLALSQLLQFEPYAGLAQDTLQFIHSMENSMKNDKIGNMFISYFSNQVTGADHISMLKKILGDPQPLVSQSHSLKEELMHTLEAWRDTTEGTYKCLGETLNKYSIFTGRNPLDLAGVPHKNVHLSMLVEDPHLELNGAQKVDSEHTKGCALETVQNQEFVSLHQGTEPNLTISQLKKELRVTDEQLNLELVEADLPDIAALFDNTHEYVEKLGLTQGQQTDVKEKTFVHDTQTGMKLALKYWSRRNPYEATYKALLLILLSLKKGTIIVSVCEYLSSKRGTSQMNFEKHSQERDDEMGIASHHDGEKKRSFTETLV